MNKKSRRILCAFVIFTAVFSIVVSDISYSESKRERIIRVRKLKAKLKRNRAAIAKKEYEKTAEYRRQDAADRKAFYKLRDERAIKAEIAKAIKRGNWGLDKIDKENRENDRRASKVGIIGDNTTTTSMEYNEKMAKVKVEWKYMGEYYAKLSYNLVYNKFRYRGENTYNMNYPYFSPSTIFRIVTSECIGSIWSNFGKGVNVYNFPADGTIERYIDVEKEMRDQWLCSETAVWFKPKKHRFFMSLYDYPTHGFFDDYPVDWVYSDLDNKRCATLKDFSIMHPELYPHKYKVWAGEEIHNGIEYCGMIDDDITYDFRDETPFSKIISTNKNGPFLYVYDFKRYRECSSDWAFHDRLLYGYNDKFEEDKDSISEHKVRKYSYHPDDKSYKPNNNYRNKAALTYGPLITDPNDELLRRLRVYIFTRMYMAKLRLAKLCHPAPKWYNGNIERKPIKVKGAWSAMAYQLDGMGSIPNYEKKYSANKVDDYNYNGKLNNKRWKTKMCNITKYANFKRYPVGQFERAKKDYQTAIAHMNIYDYWEGMYLKYIPIKKYLKAFDRYMNGKGSLSSLRYWGRMYNLSEVFRDMYLEMSNATPIRCPSVKKEDFKRYFSNDYLSIAIWAGSAGSGNYRHRSPNSLKTMFPFFEGEYKAGKMLMYNGTRIKNWYRVLSKKQWIRAVYKYAIVFYDYLEKIGKHTDPTLKYWGSKHVKKLPITIVRNEKVRVPEIMNTGGLIYGGYISKDRQQNARRLVPDEEYGKRYQYYKEYVLTDMLRHYGTMKKLWKEAIKGPFMIISSRTYEKYGHAHFEKLAGHKLRKDDITGAMIDSSAKTACAIDSDYVDQLKDMDYFYIKNSKDDKMGNRNMTPAKDITITMDTPDTEGFHKDYVAGEYSYDNSKPKVDVAKNRWKDIEKKQYVNGNNKELFDIIRKAYNKDKKRYPEISILRSHYVYFKTYYMAKFNSFVNRHGVRFLDIISKIVKKDKLNPKKAVSRLFRNDKRLMKYLRKNDLSHFAGNPNLFKAYYNNIEKFDYIRKTDKTIVKIKKYKTEYIPCNKPTQVAKTEDGTVKYEHIGGGKYNSIQNYALREFMDMAGVIDNGEAMDIKQSENEIFTKYLVSSCMNSKNKDNIVDNIPAFGTLRYNMLDRFKVKGLELMQSTMQLVNWRTEYIQQFVEDKSIAKWNIKHKHYRVSVHPNGLVQEMDNHKRTGQKRITSTRIHDSIRVRRLESRIERNSMQGSEIYPYAFPGMFRYMDDTVDYLPYKFYHRRERKVRMPMDFIDAPDIRTVVYPFGSEQAILSYMALKRNSKEIRRTTYASGLQRMNLLRRTMPTKYLERIVVPGIETTLLKKKFKESKVYKYPKELGRLYKGVTIIDKI